MAMVFTHGGVVPGVVPGVVHHDGDVVHGDVSHDVYIPCFPPRWRCFPLPPVVRFLVYDGAGQPMVVAFLELCFRFYKYHARKRTRTVAHRRTPNSHTQLARTRAFKVGVLSPFMYIRTRICAGSQVFPVVLRTIFASARSRRSCSLVQ